MKNKEKLYENIYDKIKKIIKAKYPHIYIDWDITENRDLVLMYDEGALYTGISFYRKYLIRNNKDIMFFINEIDSLFEEIF